MTGVRIMLFGVPRIELDGAPVELGRRRAMALAAYLIRGIAAGAVKG